MKPSCVRERTIESPRVFMSAMERAGTPSVGKLTADSDVFALRALGGRRRGFASAWTFAAAAIWSSLGTIASACEGWRTGKSRVSCR
jgi:hypothetical protein